MTPGRWTMVLTGKGGGRLKEGATADSTLRKKPARGKRGITLQGAGASGGP